MKLLRFFIGHVLSNGIIHFVNSISGRKFHSPFAKPFAKGLSSVWVNVIWSHPAFFHRTFVSNR